MLAHPRCGTNNSKARIPPILSMVNQWENAPLGKGLPPKWPPLPKFHLCTSDHFLEAAKMASCLQLTFNLHHLSVRTTCSWEKVWPVMRELEAGIQRGHRQSTQNHRCSESVTPGKQCSTTWCGCGHSPGFVFQLYQFNMCERNHNLVLPTITLSQKCLVHGDVDKVKCYNRCRVREGPVTNEIFINISNENKRKKK